MRLTTSRLPGLVVTDHEFRLPLDHARPDGDRITVFAREVVAPSRAKDDLPWLVFFQGGPGFESFRPADRGLWLGRALTEYRVLLLDQRGTGRSTPINRQTLGRLGDPRAQADHLALHRADSIVRDAELIRRELAGEERTWSVLGQSFGGFCVTTYLSLAPEGLREAFVTGGLPSLSATADDVYRAMYPRVLDRNRRYFERYPADEERAASIVEALRSGRPRLPGGDVLTPHRFQTLGLAFGMSDGFERLHYLMDEAFVDGAASGRELADGFLLGVEAATGHTANPLYVVLHEPCYCQGTAPRWAAHRLLAEFPTFDVEAGGPVRFTGEMVYPWMVEEYASLRPFREAAELLAERDDWPPLYAPNRLAANEVPAAAIVYHDDMYVDATLSLETAGTIKGLRTWVTNEYDHDGVRLGGEAVLGRLIELARGER